MQDKIDFLEAQIHRQTETTTATSYAMTLREEDPFPMVSTCGTSPNAFIASKFQKEGNFADGDNDQLLAYFINEMKCRTIRGTSKSNIWLIYL